MTEPSKQLPGWTAGPLAVHPFKAWIVCSQLDDDGEPCPVAALAWPTENRSEAETYANGRLFAAAPDLAEALVAVADAMLSGGDGQTGDYGWSITKLNRARPLIRAALAKALGK